MKCSPSLFPRGATWMRLCGRIRLKLWLSACWRLWLYFQRLYTSSNTPVMEKRNGRMTPLHIPNTSDTIANLSHVISSALDPLTPLLGCVCIEGNVPLSELSVWSLPRGTRRCLQEKYTAKATDGESTLLPSMCFRLAVHVHHCLLSPPVFHAWCSLAGQWPLTMKCCSGQYVSKPLGWEKREVGV